MNGNRPGWGLVLPLALAQFVATYAGTTMNVAISDVARDLHTTVSGVQTAITLFTLTMAALMIPGSKLAGIWGRRTTFLIGLAVYGAGAALAALSPGLGSLVIGYSVLEGVGSALMIPPIYILITLAFEQTTERARFFGVVSGAAGLGAAAGPLIGGLITSTLGWRASFGLQVLLVGVVIVLARRIHEPSPPPAESFDVLGAVLSAVGLFLVVLGILQTNRRGWLAASVWVSVALGALVLALFWWHVRRQERHGAVPLLPSRLFSSRTANRGLVTQNLQWLVLQGSFFVISVFLQEVWHYGAIETGLLLSPATIGLLVASAAAPRLARHHSQRRLVRAGFSLNTVGLLLILALVRSDSGVWTFVPGLLLMGTGIGVMLTSSVNVVQSSFGDADQEDISGLSRSVSNLGSSLGTAIAGSVLVAAADPGGHPFVLALLILTAFSALGLLTAISLPRRPQVTQTR